VIPIILRDKYSHTDAILFLYILQNYINSIISSALLLHIPFLATNRHLVETSCCGGFLDYPVCDLRNTENIYSLITFLVSNIFLLTKWPSGWHFCFVFGGPRIQISAKRPTILTVIFHDFPCTVP
jgi:hypothetical protein